MDELVQEVITNHRCWLHRDAWQICVHISGFVDQLAILVRGGMVTAAQDLMANYDLIDSLDIAQQHCIIYNRVLRLLMHELPEAFSTEAIELVKRRGHAIHMRQEDFRDMLITIQPDRLKDGSGIFSVFRMLSELPLIRELRRRGIDSLDACIREGFRGPACSVGLNISLLASFYRHLDPGLPTALSARLATSDNRLLATSGRLAIADLRRNLGVTGYSAEYYAAFETLQAELARPGALGKTLPIAGAPWHLTWHLLDKLSLDIRVSVSVNVAEDVTKPAFSDVSMAVLPDRDIVSTDVRRKKVFHCPEAFKAQLVEIAASTSEGALRVVEVGGYLGDCLLWAAAWLGPDRLHGLEVEPVAAATMRLTQSLKWNRFEGAIDVITEALGDGTTEMDVAAASSGLVANPNFRVRRCRSTGTRRCTRLRTLDEVLQHWPMLLHGDVVDLLRVKASGFEPQIVRGLRGHLAVSRVRQLLVQSDSEREVSSILREFPHYRSEKRRAYGSASRWDLLYRLAA